jgi:uncharacterized membrane protein HdeD (DUF308 family)
MENKDEQKSVANPLQVMGIFWVVFGLIVAISAYAPEETLGKLVNLLSGFILIIVGVFALMKGRRKKEIPGGSD